MIYAFPFLLLLVGFVFWRALSHRRRGLPSYLDLGQAFMMVVLVYGIVPGIGFLLASVGVGDMHDTRLSGGVDVHKVEHVEMLFIGFVLSFAIFYGRFRRFGPAVYQHQAAAAKPRWWLIGLALCLILGLPTARWLLGVESDDYIGSYSALRSMPLIVQQLFGVATQLSFAATVAAIVFAVAARPKRHARVAAVLLLYVLYASLTGGSRSAAFLSFFAYLVAASIYAPDFSMRRLFLLGAPALLLFMLAGLLRDKNPDVTYLALFQTGEFTALFINAIDLKDRFDNGLAEEVRFAFYLVDVLRLIPAQVLGGQKLDPAQWYVETFYPDYSEAGGGLAFGLLAESVAGTGMLDAVARGALLATVFSFAGNRLMEGRPGIGQVFVYTWLVVLAYQSFRDTTLSLGVRALYQVIPVLILLQLLRHRPRRAHRRSHHLENPEAA